MTMNYKAEDDAEIAAYGAGLNHFADDEADIAAYGEGQAWMAQDESEAEIAAYGDGQAWVAQDEDEEWFMHHWVYQDIEDGGEFEDCDAYDPECWSEDVADWQLNEDEADAET